MRRAFPPLLLAALGAVAAPALAADAPAHSSAPLMLALGANTPGVPGMPVLQYADDDAAAAAELFGAAPDRTWLLTTLDAESQERFSGVAALARPPTLQELLRASQQVAARVDELQGKGEHPVVVVWLVGHGGFDARGQPFVALADGPLTQQVLMKRVLAPLQRAHRVHVVVDACHAEAMVRARAVLEETSKEEVRRHFLEADVVQADNIGYLVAAGAAQKTFEWQEMRAGVFSALVRSGMRGAANADGDGCVTYDEVGAFVTASLQGISIPEARPRVSARPPRVEHGAPLSCGAWFPGSARLSADMGAMGQVHVEDLRGVWLAGGRFEPGHLVSLWLPLTHTMVLRGGTQEWPIEVDQANAITLAQQPAETSAVSRGAVERAMNEGLFSVAFGPGYLRGYQARAPVDVPPAAREQRTPLHLLAWTSVPFFAGALLSSGVLLAGGAGLALSVVEFVATDLQRPAQIALNHAGISAVVMGAALMAALVLCGVGVALLAADVIF